MLKCDFFYYLKFKNLKLFDRVGVKNKIMAPSCGEERRESNKSEKFIPWFIFAVFLIISWNIWNFDVKIVLMFLNTNQIIKVACQHLIQSLSWRGRTLHNLYNCTNKYEETNTLKWKFQKIIKKLKFNITIFHIKIPGWTADSKTVY